MARRKGFMHTLAQLEREAKRAAAAQERNQRAAMRESLRAQREYERAVNLAEKERKRLYIESREAEVAALNDQLVASTGMLESLLRVTLEIDDYFDLDRLKSRESPPRFEPGEWENPTPAIPSLDSMLPRPLTWLTRKVPGAVERWARAEQAARDKHRALTLEREAKEQNRLQLLDKARQEYDVRLREFEERIRAQHEEIDEFKRSLAAGEPDAVVTYFALVLERSTYPEGFPQEFRLAYVPESHQLVVEYQLPGFESIPNCRAFKYTKSSDQISEVARPERERKALYERVVAQVALRTVHEVFEADRLQILESIVFNGHVSAIDPAKGSQINPCLLTLRTSREVFSQLDLANVDPVACLKGLSASVSKSPTELAPVRPILEFSMVDSRFIEEVDIISGLDKRPNLMELTPLEFEALISNLFEKMGLETRATRASRDGGVDCVAFDPRPIFGGKVVIQAKRYKNTVGVSAVRDLFGTLQNEGASKGILVTTSGFGAAAYEFAAGKPLELLSGSHLLYLLMEHAGLEAKIVPPEDWRDPAPDTPEPTPVGPDATGGGALRAVPGDLP